ncbi:unnamed protein product, partial [Gulo gulo]
MNPLSVEWTDLTDMVIFPNASSPAKWMDIVIFKKHARKHDNLNSEFMELDLENNWVLELVAVESTGRTQ